MFKFIHGQEKKLELSDIWFITCSKHWWTYPFHDQ